MKTYKGQEITMDNFVACIPYEQLEITMGKKNYKEFMKWMFGQTVPIGGVYTWDLERWFIGLPCID